MVFEKATHYRQFGRRALVAVLSLVVILGLTACDDQPAATEEVMDMESDETMDGMDMAMPGVDTGVEIEHGDLRIQNIWGLPAFEGDNGAVYLTVINMGDVPDVLAGIQTEVAAGAQIHQMQLMDDIMRMQAVEGGLELPAGETVQLAPGGYHIMLVGLNRELVEGDSYSVMLEFDVNGDVTVEVAVVQP